MPDKNFIMIPSSNMGNSNNPQVQSLQHAGVGGFQHQGTRPSQQDTACFSPLSREDLNSLSPQNIAQRLWSANLLLDKRAIISKTKAGSTACTTIYNGEGVLVTANIGDSSVFIALFDTEKDQCLGVRRVNSILHQPRNPKEASRIIGSNGRIINNRVEGQLAVSRAVGGSQALKKWISAEAHIDIISINDILTYFKIDAECFASQKIKLLLIPVSDGFTDAAGKNASQEICEKYLFNQLKICLETISFKNANFELDFAKSLVASAVEANRKSDNVTVVAVSLTPQTPPCLVAINDGHAGDEVSKALAINGAECFKMQCLLSFHEYFSQPVSIFHNLTAYLRDNNQHYEPIEHFASFRYLKDGAEEIKVSPEQNDKYHSSHCLSIVPRNAGTRRTPNSTPSFFPDTPVITITNTNAPEKGPRNWEYEQKKKTAAKVLKDYLSNEQYVTLHKEIQKYIIEHPEVVLDLMKTGGFTYKDMLSIQAPDAFLSICKAKEPKPKTLPLDDNKKVHHLPHNSNVMVAAQAPADPFEPRITCSLL